MARLKIGRGMALARQVRSHAFVTAAIVGVVVGGGLRFVPTGTAAPAGANGAGQGAAASTACAAS